MSAQIIDALEWRSNRHRRKLRDHAQRQREAKEASRITLDDNLNGLEPRGGDHAA